MWTHPCTTPLRSDSSYSGVKYRTNNVAPKSTVAVTGCVRPRATGGAEGVPQHPLRRRAAGLERERDRRAEGQEHGRHHPEQHVLEDVVAEEDGVVAGDAGLGGHDDDGGPAHERRRTTGRPVAAAAAQTPYTADVAPHRGDDEDQCHDVDPLRQRQRAQRR
jgi:hypothetical protein